jgi:hypothetical protein
MPSRSLEGPSGDGKISRIFSQGRRRKFGKSKDFGFEPRFRQRILGSICAEKYI